MLGDTELQWQRDERDGCTVVRPRGVLNPTTYRCFSDDLVKFTVEEPRAVIVVLDDLRVSSEPLLSVFASVSMRVGDWPGVPVLLVVELGFRRAVLRSSAIRRFVPVFATVTAAVRSLEHPPLRRWATLDLAPTGDCAQRARRFVDDICQRWDTGSALGDAQLIATELVENSFLHSRSEADIRVRLELRDDLLTVAVADADPREAVLREPGPGGPRFYGLHVVARLARAWGCAPKWPIGKVVWATVPVGPRREPR
ncbi:ATP-binding protein [Nocardia otitidiscaviarum]|uniref:ATP-binding protein n=1 Tax=Nocardia otitidiscaviarum TaxID=1823 RepID=A0A516NRU8_9NOCA|nr:ATP-binding protein [Nocardia otitidiscaviarum]MCP9620848.1 ATP-binding protein [Nocardia otitidiscaviarum]QDP81635.1 ATP-binding protein [Nocardia otitidiscaviarum]